MHKPFTTLPHTFPHFVDNCPFFRVFLTLRKINRANLFVIVIVIVFVVVAVVVVGIRCIANHARA